MATSRRAGDGNRAEIASRVGPQGITPPPNGASLILGQIKGITIGRSPGDGWNGPSFQESPTGLTDISPNPSLRDKHPPTETVARIYRRNSLANRTGKLVSRRKTRPMNPAPEVSMSENQIPNSDNPTPKRKPKGSPRLDLVRYLDAQLRDSLSELNIHATCVEFGCTRDYALEHRELLLDHYARHGGAAAYAQYRSQFEKLCDLYESCFLSEGCKLAQMESDFIRCPMRRLSHHCRALCQNPSRL